MARIVVPSRKAIDNLTAQAFCPGYPELIPTYRDLDRRMLLQTTVTDYELRIRYKKARDPQGRRKGSQ